LITLGRQDFDEACGTLMRRVEMDFAPDLMVGIQTGGMVVARSMADATVARLPVFPVTSRRAGTGAKARLPLLREVLTVLPRWVVDRLRRAEYRLLIASRGRRRPDQWVDRSEAEAVAAHCNRGSGRPRILIVDDAVDSGATLAAVLRTLREMCPEDTVIRSAAITQTMPNPLVRPDYVLFHRTLCRFPWSFDA
jgi:hypoxanthine phosphoribosyltransferase